jgi:hypothetical protein
MELNEKNYAERIAEARDYYSGLSNAATAEIGIQVQGYLEAQEQRGVPTEKLAHLVTLLGCIQVTIREINEAARQRVLGQCPVQAVAQEVIRAVRSFSLNER